jgi:hypothetical protein
MRTRTTRAALLVAALAGLLPLSVASAADPAGVARMVVTPATLTAGSTGNDLTFNFIANRSLTGQTIVDVPRGWTVPQRRNASGPGYVELKRGTCGGSTRITAIASRRLRIATACKRGHGYQLLYHKATVPTIAADGYIFLTQTRTSGAKAKFHPLARSGQPVVKVKGGPATGLDLTLTSVVTAGATFTVTVRAIDPYSNNAFPYGATVTLTSSDPVATLPGPYAYQPSDLAQHAFTGVVLRTPGTQTITATDSSGLTEQSPPIVVNSS